jgi:hypothetical protein
LSAALRQLAPPPSPKQSTIGNTTPTCPPPQAENPDEPAAKLSVRKKPHFLLDLNTGAIKANPLRGDNQVEVTVSPFNDRVVLFLTSQEGTLSTEAIEIWKEATLIIHGGKSRVRASSCYDNFGQFFDWVSVQSDPMNDQSCYPAKLLLIYQDRNGHLCGIVHGCSWRNNNEKRLSTPLSSRWSLEFHPTTGHPVLRKIKMNDIVEVLYVIEHMGEDPKALGLNVPIRNKTRGKYCVDVIEPRYLWAETFLDHTKTNNKQKSG